jgi:hypothetical protein
MNNILSKITINHILYVITFLAILAYMLKINRAVYYLIFTSMIVVFYMIIRQLNSSICIAGIITALIYVFVDRQPLKKRKSMLLMEHYADAGSSSTSIEPRDESKPEKPARKSSKKSKKSKAKAEAEAEQENFKDDTENEQETFEPISDNKIDEKSSYLEMFKSLKPNEVAGLNKDTQELMATQKQLMETLQNMGPALKEGKNILDTFKNYFGDTSAMGKLGM